MNCEERRREGIERNREREREYIGKDRTDKTAKDRGNTEKTETEGIARNR